MCGIIGIIKHNPAENVDKEILIHARDTMIHRGPDECGVFIDGHVGLGHRRLSIIDLSTGKQPMCSPDNKFCIVFNGEIYNYSELRSYLESKGMSFKTKSDTEVILNLYILMRKECVKKLRGMFSFAVWDSVEGILFCARDHLGKKPFFYTKTKDCFCFSSEIKALLDINSVKKNTNYNAIEAFLTLGYIPGNQTSFENIYKLPPAHYMVFKNGIITIEKYWHLPDHEKIYTQLSEEDAKKNLIDLFDDSVKCRLMSEVPLGAFLSGGIDSTSVVASMKKFLDNVITTTVGFTNKQFDESNIAADSAAFYKTDHKAYSIKPDSLSIINKIVDSFDEPFADVSAIPTYYVCQLARNNVTVALSGDGGDELFGGYNWYDTYIKNRRYGNNIKPFSLPLSIFTGFISTPVKGGSFCKSLCMNDWDALIQTRSVFDMALKHSTYSHDFYKTTLQNPILETMKSDFLNKTKSMDYLRKMQYFDMKYYLPDDILVKSDRMSMANSLEVRAPLLDFRLAEFAWKLPSNFKIRDSQRKFILRSAMASRLPNGLLSLTKKGFTPPVTDWLTGSMRDFTISTLFSSKAKGRGILNTKKIQLLWNSFEKKRILLPDMSTVLWALLMLELWFCKYIDE
jgi:asparagine synthase (glutamine-hydrolysing)